MNLYACLPSTSAHINQLQPEHAVHDVYRQQEVPKQRVVIMLQQFWCRTKRGVWAALNLHAFTSSSLYYPMNWKFS
jgi:hypothetical protein